MHPLDMIDNVPFGCEHFSTYRTGMTPDYGLRGIRRRMADSLVLSHCVAGAEGEMAYVAFVRSQTFVYCLFVSLDVAFRRERSATDVTFVPCRFRRVLVVDLVVNKVGQQCKASFTLRALVVSVMIIHCSVDDPVVSQDSPIDVCLAVLGCFLARCWIRVSFCWFLA
jgi:hypothetical protein